MGMSHALYETTEPYYPSREHSPRDFAEYVLPGPAEAPEMESVVIERPSSTGPYGAKGIGEMTANSPIAVMADPVRNYYGIQFHPEVVHTPKGKEILQNFVRNICGSAGTW